jgi:hypothetical protein
MVATAARICCASVKRASATIMKSASAEQKESFVRADGPWRKKGGGVRSRVPSAIVPAALRQLIPR